MSNVHLSALPFRDSPAGDPSTMSRAARARAIRQRLRHPPNAVIDDGIDFKRKNTPPSPPSEAKAERGHLLQTLPPEPNRAAAPSQLTVTEVLKLDRQINTLVAELERLYARREQRYLASVHRRPATATIQRVVARHYGVTLVDLLSARRTKQVAFARQVAVYLVRQHTLLSLPAIGRLFGNRDHTTILHAARKIRVLRERDPELSETLDALAALIAPAPTMVEACNASDDGRFKAHGKDA
jgi:hypothetical protein